MAAINWKWRNCKKSPPPKGVPILFWTQGEIKEFFVSKVEDRGNFHKGELWMALPEKK